MALNLPTWFNESELIGTGLGGALGLTFGIVKDRNSAEVAAATAGGAIIGYALGYFWTDIIGWYNNLPTWEKYLVDFAAAGLIGLALFGLIGFLIGGMFGPLSYYLFSRYKKSNTGGSGGGTPTPTPIPSPSPAPVSNPSAADVTAAYNAVVSALEAAGYSSTVQASFIDGVANQYAEQIAAGTATIAQAVSYAQTIISPYSASQASYNQGVANATNTLYNELIQAGFTAASATAVSNIFGNAYYLGTITLSQIISKAASLGYTPVSSSSSSSSGSSSSSTTGSSATAASKNSLMSYNLQASIEISTYLIAHNIPVSLAQAAGVAFANAYASNSMSLNQIYAVTNEVQIEQAVVSAQNLAKADGSINTYLTSLGVPAAIATSIAILYAAAYAEGTITLEAIAAAFGIALA